VSAVSDNLESLRAYPLTAPGSTAQDNVTKLRIFSIGSVRRVFVNATLVNGLQSRSKPRTFANATIGDS